MHRNEQPNSTEPALILSSLPEATAITMLEQYNRKYNCYNRQEIINLFSGHSKNKKVHHAACFYLLTKGEVGLLDTFIYNMNFQYCDSEGRSILLGAIISGDVATVKWVLKKQYDRYHVDMFSKKDRNGQGPVLTAVQYGHIKMLHYLVKSKRDGGCGLSIDEKDAKGDGVISIALSHMQIKMLDKLTKSEQEGGFGLSKTSDGTNIRCELEKKLVLKVITLGKVKTLHELIRPKEKRAFEFSLDVEDDEGNDPVLMAIKHGHPEMFLELIKPESDGGFNLSLDVKNRSGQYPLILSIIHDRDSIFKRLMLINIETISYDKKCELITAAILHNRINMLKKLIIPLEENIYHFLCNALWWMTNNNNDETIMWIFFRLVGAALRINNYEEMIRIIQNGLAGSRFNVKMLADRILTKVPKIINQLLLAKDFTNASVVLSGLFGMQYVHITVNLHEYLRNVTWNTNDFSIMRWGLIEYFNVNLDSRGLQAACIKTEIWASLLKKKDVEINNTLIKHYQYLLNFYLQASEDKNLEIILAELEAFKQGAGYSFLANTYVEMGDFCNAFHTFLTIFKNNKFSDEVKLNAGYEIANLIITGYIQLTDKGEVDKDLTEKQGLLPEKVKNKNGKNKDIMVKRAIYAYEYDFDHKASSLVCFGRRFDRILSGLISLDNSQVDFFWQVDAVNKYFNYYVEKNPLLLKAKAFIDSQNNIYKKAQEKPKEIITLSQSHDSFFPRPLRQKNGVVAETVDLESAANFRVI